MATTTRARRPWRLGPRATTAFDVVLASLLVAGSVVSFAAGYPYGAVLSVAETAPLFWRRRHPAAVFTVVASVSAVQALTFDLPAWGQMAFPVALYSVARFGRPRDSWVALAVSIVATFTASTVWIRRSYFSTDPSYRGELTLVDFVPYTLSIGAIVLAAWALGTQARLRRAYETTLIHQGEQMAAEAEQRAIAAAADERARVAREMHDVVAHGITAMIVQADGARYAAEKDPRVATDTLATVAGTGRDALAEMRRLLGLLRGSTDPALVPQPALPDLAGLLDDDVASGRVTADLPDPLPEVPDGIGLTVFRVVQEALTNVRRHAGPNARATVRLTAEPSTLTVEVVDDGHGAAAEPGTGLGLLGMRERVEVHGGTIEAGPAPAGGWAVRARIPR